MFFLNTLPNLPFRSGSFSFSKGQFLLQIGVLAIRPHHYSKHNSSVDLVRFLYSSFLNLLIVVSTYVAYSVRLGRFRFFSQITFEGELSIKCFNGHVTLISGVDLILVSNLGIRFHAMISMGSIGLEKLGSLSGFFGINGGIHGF